MATVTVELPAHSEFQTDRIRWQDTTTGLANVSAFSAFPPLERYLGRFQLDGNGTDNDNQAQVRAGETPTDSLSAHNHELSVEWEQSTTAVTVQVAGLTDLVIQGPDGPNVLTSDTTESYLWVPGGDYTNGAITYTYSGNNQPAGLAAWVEDFKAAYTADTTLRATLVFDDGQSGIATVTLTGQTLAADVVISEGTLVVGSSTPAVTLTGQTLSAVATISEGTISTSAISAITLTAQVLAASVTISEGVLSSGAVRPTAPRYPGTIPTGYTSLDIYWRVPALEGESAITGYQVRVDSGAWENTGSTLAYHRVRGLAVGHSYDFDIRAVNASGSGPVASVAGTPQRIALIGRGVRPPRVPLQNTDRQSVVIRLSGRDCRLTVWYQSSDTSWYGSLEIPVGTPAVSGRRLGVDTGLLSRVYTSLAGNLWCRSLSGQAVDPGREPWGSTHALFWEIPGL